MTNDIALFKGAGLSLDNIGKYKAAIERVQMSAPQAGGVPLLRLDKEGFWVYGNSGQPMTDVEDGSLWAANPLTFQKGFTAWQQGINKPRGSQLKNILSGELVDERMLPDLAPAKWSESVEVEFQCLNGADKGTVVKYVANSLGGVERWHQLVAHLNHQFSVNPNKLVPVVSLEHDGYFHSDQTRGVRKDGKPGWIVKPIFKVIDWMSMDGKGAEPQEEIEDQGSATDPEPQQERRQSTGRRVSTIQPNGNDAAPQSTRRQSTIQPVKGMQAQPGTAETDADPRNPNMTDPVVRRRRRLAQ